MFLKYLFKVLSEKRLTFYFLCRASLERLSVPQIGLYQIHWPGFLTQGFSNDAFVKGLAQVANKGLTKAVGVSNFRADRVRRAASILEVKPRDDAGNWHSSKLL